MSFFLAMALFSSCGTHETNLTVADNGSQINAKSGDVITLTLASNPTTGYSWQVMEINNIILTQVGDAEYKSDGRNILGAGGMETFRFEAVGAGETMLELGYMRPWESVQPLETYSIQVIVQ